MTQRDGEGAEFIIEFTQVGGSMKVTAIDPQTLVEASIVAPVNLPRDLLSRQAVQKLHYVLAKKNRPPSGKE